jgi:PAS domain S-box-containing protein
MHRKNTEDDVNDLTDLIVREVKDYAIFLLDDGGHVRSWNDGAALIKGYAADEIIGRHFAVFYTEEDRARGQPLYELTMAREQGRYEDEGWRVRKDGKLLWINEIITAIHDGSGTAEGVPEDRPRPVAPQADGGRLRESEERHRLLVENVRDYAVFMVDPDGRVLTWNPGAQRVFGYAEEEIVGRHGSILFTTEDIAADEHDKELATALSEGAPPTTGGRCARGASGSGRAA